MLPSMAPPAGDRVLGTRGSTIPKQLDSGTSVGHWETHQENLKLLALTWLTKRPHRRQ